MFDPHGTGLAWANAAAFRMHRQMGRARVAARIRSLNDQLEQGLSKNPKVKMHTPMSGDLSAGLVAFEVDGVAPADVVKQLLAMSLSLSSPAFAPHAAIPSDRYSDPCSRRRASCSRSSCMR